MQESAPALAALAHDSGALTLACRRLLEHHPASGPLAWLCARVLGAEDGRAESWRCAREIDGDTTAECLAGELPDMATVVVLGWPEVAAAALARRGDVAPLVVDAGHDGDRLARRLRDIGIDAHEVPEAGMAAAVRAADLVILEAEALGPGGFAGLSGSYAAAAVAGHAGVPVWATVGVGRRLPPGLWGAMAQRLQREEPWNAAEELVPLDLVDVVIRPTGPTSAADPAGAADCADAPELR